MGDEQAQAQSAPQPTVLGEMIEVVVRVPIDRHSSFAAVMGIPDDDTHEDIAAWVREEYPSPAGFIADWWDKPGAQVATRIRARDNNPDTMFRDWLKDEFVKIWEVARDPGPAA